MDNAKIFVVVAVLLVIFAGIVVYLVSMERRLRKLEKENPKKNS
ncbi:MAG: CcmD family protein [Bacteroidales bacterium]